MLPKIRQLDYSGQNIYAGIDVHKNSWRVTIYSDELYHKTFSQPPMPELLYKYLSKHFPNGTYYSVYEAGFCGFWIHKQFQSFGINNMVVNPADVPTTDKEKKQKEDPRDSNKLAKQLRSGSLEPIYVHKNQILQDRSLIRYRRTLVKELTRNKNRVKSMLHFYGVDIPESFYRDQRYWSKRFLVWLTDLDLGWESGSGTLYLLIEHVKFIRENLLLVNKKIRELAKTNYYHQRVNLLMSISGIGLLTAMIILTEIDDINRFNNQEKLHSYIGLIPSSYSSGDNENHGEMINRGNKFLKPVIIESAWTAARVNPVLHREFLKHCQRMKRNKAVVRIAKKIMNQVRFVLTNEVPIKNGID